MAYTDIDKSDDYFNTKLYSGDSATNQAITGVNFQPDLVWIKARTEVHQHNLFDVIRGVNKNLSSNLSSAEATDNQYGYLASYDTDGFTTQKGSSSGQWNVNQTGENYVAWNWLADNTSGSSNTQGSITSTVSANTTSGFSIVSFTGTGATGTVGHGLGGTPEIYIRKSRTNAENWFVYTTLIDGSVDYLYLNVTDAKANSGATAPTSTVFEVGAGEALGEDLITYCFRSIKGYSKMGTYTGNGSTDGTMIVTGMKPAFVMIKRIDSNGNWWIFDNKRDPDNDVTLELGANLSNAEDGIGSASVDFLSNGLKFRTTQSDLNASGGTYIYMCFAESPFTTSTGIPNTAR